MNTTDLEHLLNGTKPMPKCNDIYASFGAVKGKGYSCPNCGKIVEGYKEYDVDDEHYPILLNENKGGTIDGDYWDWDEVHCCTNCKTKYWFNNGI